MEPDKSDTNLLFGILAVKMNFIRQDDLLRGDGDLVPRPAEDPRRDPDRAAGALPEGSRSPRRDGPREPGSAGPARRSNGQDRPDPADPAERIDRADRGPARATLAQLTDRSRSAEGQRINGRSGRIASKRRAATSDYVVVRPHAKGGIGKVSVALDVQLNREVALKELLDEHLEKPDSRARFLLEAEVTARLEHPGIVPVYGIGLNAPGRAVLRDAIHQGRELQGRGPAVSQGPRRPRPAFGPVVARFQQLLRRFVDVCDTIEYAHSRGVIHRDLKPSNVIVGKYGETLVVDWGLAKFVGQDEKHVSAGRGDAPAVVAQRVDRHDRRVRRGDSGVHEPGAGGGGHGPRRVRQRRLRPGGDPLLPADRTEPDHGPGGHDGPPSRTPRRVPPAARGQPARSRSRWRRSA